jgi:hypothetical protein
VRSHFKQIRNALALSDQNMLFKDYGLRLQLYSGGDNSFDMGPEMTRVILSYRDRLNLELKPQNG